MYGIYDMYIKYIYYQEILMTNINVYYNDYDRLICL